MLERQWREGGGRNVGLPFLFLRLGMTDGGTTTTVGEEVTVWIATDETKPPDEKTKNRGVAMPRRAGAGPLSVVCQRVRRSNIVYSVLGLATRQPAV